MPDTQKYFFLSMSSTLLQRHKWPTKLSSEDHSNEHQKSPYLSSKRKGIPAQRPSFIPSNVILLLNQHPLNHPPPHFPISIIKRNGIRISIDPCIILLLILFFGFFFLSTPTCFRFLRIRKWREKKWGRVLKQYSNEKLSILPGIKNGTRFEQFSTKRFQTVSVVIYENFIRFYLFINKYI